MKPSTSQIRLLICSLLVSISIRALSQDIHYAQSVIDLLTASDMHGRGYVENGHRKAADYIASEFEEFGLQSFSLNYQQQFPIDINTFPSKMSVKVDNQSLEPGVDFLIDPASPGINGGFDVLNLPIDTLLKNTSEWVKAIKETSNVVNLIRVGYEQLVDEDKSVIDGIEDVLKYNKNLTIPAVIITGEDKLTWSTSQRLNGRSIFYLRAEGVDSTSFERVRFNVKNELLKDHFSQNVIGFLAGELVDSIIVVSAHYDHLGRMGKSTYFPGANDNASGVSMMLSLARHFSFFDKPKYSILFIAFGGEEAGLVGSQYFVNRPVYPLAKLKFIINLDIVGTGEDGITVVNGRVYNKEFDRLVDLNDQKKLLANVAARGSACNSDHCSFDQHGVPGFFIYTRGGIQAYHDINDQSATLPLTEFEDLFSLLSEYIQGFE